MNSRTFTIVLAALTVLGIYLFVTAPEKLPEPGRAKGASAVPIEIAFKIIAHQQATARAVYTADIVGPGQKVGLKFGEQWKREGVEEGPLPALLLRETAGNIKKTSVQIGLFLGSDFPISPSNKFVGVQATYFEQVKKTQQPVFFHSADTGAYTAMFPDFSRPQPCVTCHNTHPDSPKTDWTTQDVMGATTWTYPNGTVSPAELAKMVVTVRAAVKDAYSAYLKKAVSLSKPPQIGTGWPRDGYFLPSVETFMAEVDRRGGGEALGSVLDALQGK